MALLLLGAVVLAGGLYLKYANRPRGTAGVANPGTVYVSRVKQMLKEGDVQGAQRLSDEFYRTHLAVQAPPGWASRAQAEATPLINNYVMLAGR